MTSRRKFITAGISGAAGVSGIALAARNGLIPPDHGGVYGIGETLTYAAHRVLTSRQSLAREFSRADISKVAPVNGPPPQKEDYQRLLAGDFADWRLTVDGMVAHPASLSLADLKNLPLRSQITHQACEEGWSFIAEWTGVPVAQILSLVGAHPEARYAVFYPFDESWESIDMADATHPQTLLALGMNGKDLPAGHGAPVRLRVARQLGYKSVKYLRRMTVVDSVKNLGKGRGGAAADDYGYAWYAGI